MSTNEEETHASEPVPVEEKCWQMMDLVVQRRILCTEHIKKANKNIANIEAILLEREMKRKIEPPSDFMLNSDDLECFGKQLSIPKSDDFEFEGLKSRISNLHKILKQIEEDEKGRVLWEPCDQETIIRKLQNRMESS